MQDMQVAVLPTTASLLFQSYTSASTTVGTENHKHSKPIEKREGLIKLIRISVSIHFMLYEYNIVYILHTYNPDYEQSMINGMHLNMIKYYIYIHTYIHTLHCIA